MLKLCRVNREHLEVRFWVRKIEFILAYSDFGREFETTILARSRETDLRIHPILLPIYRTQLQYNGFLIRCPSSAPALPQIPSVIPKAVLKSEIRAEIELILKQNAFEESLKHFWAAFKAIRVVMKHNATLGVDLKKFAERSCRAEIPPYTASALRDSQIANQRRRRPPESSINNNTSDALFASNNYAGCMHFLAQMTKLRWM